MVNSSQFAKGISKNLQKLLRYLKGIVTSTFKVGTGGRAGWSASPEFSGCGSLSGAFLLFLFYM